MTANDPAFPTHDADPTTDPRNRITTGGLTKREWFAGIALQMLPHVGETCLTPEEWAHDAFAIADALIAASGEAA